MKKKILEIKNLTKYYGKVLGVKDLTLNLEEGEITSISLLESSWEMFSPYWSLPKAEKNITFSPR